MVDDALQIGLECDRGAEEVVVPSKYFTLLPFVLLSTVSVTNAQEVKTLATLISQGYEVKAMTLEGTQLSKVVSFFFVQKGTTAYFCRGDFAFAKPNIGTNQCFAVNSSQ